MEYDCSACGEVESVLRDDTKLGTLPDSLATCSLCGARFNIEEDWSCEGEDSWLDGSSLGNQILPSSAPGAITKEQAKNDHGVTL